MTAVRLRELVILCLLGAVGLAGTASAVAGRGADSSFLFRQEHPLRLQASDVERVVRTAPEPIAGKRTPGAAAVCRPHGSRGLRNPWTCTVRYRSGRRSRLHVEVRDDGSYLGRYAGGGATAEGCCISVPDGG